MAEFAVIGGSGLDQFEDLEISHRETVSTPYGEPSAPLSYGKLNGRDCVFLPRHGMDHSIAPHKINYRANIHALHSIGIKKVIAIAAVGGITPQMHPGALVIPDQIIDYTWSRKHTFFEDDAVPVTHVDFTHPYCELLREQLIDTAAHIKQPVMSQATYAATQGPRLESSAEINRLERDGCDLVGMTGMPEAALARELDLCYASCCVVANWAAGKSEGEISMAEIERVLAGSMVKVRALLSVFLQ